MFGLTYKYNNVISFKTFNIYEDMSSFINDNGVTDFKIVYIPKYKLLVYQLICCIKILIEKIRGVDFTSPSLSEYYGCFAYEASDKKTIKNILMCLDTRGKTIVDVGCGKGYVLNLFSNYEFKTIIGIDNSKRLISICRNNIKDYRTNIIDGDINEVMEKYGIIADYYYLFNPFDSTIFTKFIYNVLNNKNPYKPSYIIYKNPVCENILLDNGFEKTLSISDSLGIETNIYVRWND